MFNSMKRLCTSNGHYLVEIEEQTELREQVQALVNNLNSNEEACDEFRRKFTQYSDMWSLDIQDSFKAWWDETAVPVEEEEKKEIDPSEMIAPPAPPEEATGAAGEGEEDGEVVDEDAVEVEKFPPLPEFAKKIDEYSTIRDHVNSLLTQDDVGWLRVDCKPVRQQVLECPPPHMSLPPCRCCTGPPPHAPPMPPPCRCCTGLINGCSSGPTSC